MRLLKNIIVTAIIISMLAVSTCLHASALIIFENGFGFEVNSSEHEATLVRYDENDEYVTLPTYFHGYPVRVIDRSAFSGNEKIKEIVFSDTNTTVDEYAFKNCTSLETVYIPENVVSFGDSVFADCTSLKNVTLLSDIVSLPANMFSGCTSLENLTLNERIAEFSYGCFNGCAFLSNLDFVSNCAILQSYSFNGTGAESVVLGDSLLAVPNYAFTNCPNLKYVTIPESVALIQPYAFNWENITIRCYYDSFAYDYARQNNISYELIDGVIYGDTNGDGAVNINDVTVIQRHLAKLNTVSGIYLYASDINRDGEVSIADATGLQMYLAEYKVNYPIGEIIKQ